jgi:hypothetical protein
MWYIPRWQVNTYLSDVDGTDGQKHAQEYAYEETRGQDVVPSFYIDRLVSVSRTISRISMKDNERVDFSTLR